MFKLHFRKFKTTEMLSTESKSNNATLQTYTLY